MLSIATYGFSGPDNATPTPSGTSRVPARFGADADSGDCMGKPCVPGNEYCAEPFENAPQYHLMDQHGCGENDPNGPVFDPVHGVFHHFYQIHLAAPPGHGPDYGHFVSKDFIHWAQLPVAIWNGLDSSVTPAKVTKYDNEAIFTGSAVVVDGAGPGGKPGIVNIYPGLCNKDDWPACETGTLLAQAVPADYAGDELLVNWTKPDYNPIVENAQRDPSTPWKNADTGEWRLRTFDSMVYGSASDADMLAGKWYTIGKSADFRTCECPSVYPLPAASPGTEEAYAAAQKAGALPNTVHKTSCGGDWTQLGTYVPAPAKVLGAFNATPGWDDLFVQKRIDVGGFYASKDNEYPTLDGGTRRINWGWAMVPPQSTQTLPREVTFNVAARTLQQYPIDELKALRGDAAYGPKTGVAVADGAEVDLVPWNHGSVQASETLVSFTLPSSAATFGLTIGTLSCTVAYDPSLAAATDAAYVEVPFTCGKLTDTLRLLKSETAVELRVFADVTFVEVFAAKGRVAMTVAEPIAADAAVKLTATGADVTADVAAYPLESPWVTPDAVRQQKRVYG